MQSSCSTPQPVNHGQVPTEGGKHPSDPPSRPDMVLHLITGQACSGGCWGFGLAGGRLGQLDAREVGSGEGDGMGGMGHRIIER